MSKKSDAVQDIETFLETNPTQYRVIRYEYGKGYLGVRIFVKEPDEHGMATFVQFFATIHEGKRVISFFTGKGRLFVPPDEKILGFADLFATECFMLDGHF